MCNLYQLVRFWNLPRHSRSFKATSPPRVAVRHIRCIRHGRVRQTQNHAVFLKIVTQTPRSHGCSCLLQAFKNLVFVDEALPKNRRLDIRATVPAHCSGIDGPHQARISRIRKISWIPSAAEPWQIMERNGRKLPEAQLRHCFSAFTDRNPGLSINSQICSGPNVSSSPEIRWIRKAMGWQKTTWAKERFDHVWSMFVAHLVNFSTSCHFVTTSHVLICSYANPETWKWPNWYQTDTKLIPNWYQTDTKLIPNQYECAYYTTAMKKV